MTDELNIDPDYELRDQIGDLLFRLDPPGCVASPYLVANRIVDLVEARVASGAIQLPTSGIDR